MFVPKTSNEDRMTEFDQNVRIQCLHMANRIELTPAEVVETAQRFYDFIMGNDKPQPKPALQAA